MPLVSSSFDYNEHIQIVAYNAVGYVYAGPVVSDTVFQIRLYMYHHKHRVVCLTLVPIYLNIL